MWSYGIIIKDRKVIRLRAYYILCAVIPVIIFFVSFNTLDKRIRNSRLKHAIPAFFTMFANGYLVYYQFFVKDVDEMELVLEYPYLQLVPAALVLISFIFYKKGKGKEGFINADLISDSVEEIRFRKRRESTSVELSTSESTDDNSSGDVI